MTFQSGSSGCTAIGATVTCVLGNLAPGAGATFAVVGKVITPGNYSASASIISDVTDPVTSNNSVSLTTNVTVSDPGRNDNVPTLPEWGAILMSIVLMISVLLNERKRRFLT